jgi:hypothetical protein
MDYSPLLHPSLFRYGGYYQHLLLSTLLSPILLIRTDTGNWRHHRHWHTIMMIKPKRFAVAASAATKACLTHECEFGYGNFPRKYPAGLLLHFGHFNYDSSDVPLCYFSGA